MFGVIRFFSLVICLSTLLLGSELRAQGAADVYVQIEARSAKDAAMERAAAYAATFPNVQGFRVGNGWYGIALGPFTAEEAENQLRLLRNEGLIPSDSYLTDQSGLGERFWPTTEAMAPAAPETTAETAPDTAAEELATEELAAAEAQPEPVEPVALPEESRSEALASEALLASEGRMDLQRAMQWFGTYSGAIDGSFGKGTRGAMAAWQEAAGYEPTGVLTTAQRTEILTAWEEERTSLGLTTVTEEEAGIRIELPLGLVAFDHYDPPFATFAPKGDSGYQVLLISRQGDAKSLVALFERLQALSIIPISGDRTVEKNSFQLNGEGNGTTAYAEARLDGGFIKGFALIAPTEDTHRRERVLAAMKTSFAPVGETALDESLGVASSVSQGDLTSGLDIRRPALSRSGIFVDGEGAVLTTTEILQSCTKLTLNGRYAVNLVWRDDKLGIALLKPESPLAPRGFASFAEAQPRPEAQVTLAGYSYGDRLSQPAITMGHFAEAAGLAGEKAFSRLELGALEGDRGGAVLDTSGALIGMLAPYEDEAGRELPEDVSFVIQSAALTAALEANQSAPTLAENRGALSAEELGQRARDMVVLISCWK